MMVFEADVATMARADVAADGTLKAKRPGGLKVCHDS